MIFLKFTTCEPNYRAEHETSKILRNDLLKHFYGIDVKPGDIAKTESGKPYLISKEAVFSISHSDGTVVCAVSSDISPLCSAVPISSSKGIISPDCFYYYDIGEDKINDMGIDIELIPQDGERVKYNRLAQRYFSPGEREILQSNCLDDQSFISNFLIIWAMKESRVKLNGKGLSGIKFTDVSIKDPTIKSHSEFISINGSDFSLAISYS